MDLTWITTSWTAVLMVIISSIGIYVALIAFTRIAGLRSFSKMSSFDFAMTVAIGSLIASTIISDSPPLYQAMVALAVLYILQITVAILRVKSTIISKIVNNQPLLLMRGENILEDNLKDARVTYDDLRAKLREANVTQMSQIYAVVMEATGDISVMHNDNDEHKLDDILLQGVRGWNE